jgi:pyrroline-5-carboxylate reductase
MIGFIGGGNMAEALIKGMMANGMKDILVSEPMGVRRKYLEDTYGVTTTTSNRTVASSCSSIVLAVKPQQIDSVLDEITDVVDDEKTIVSIAAGVTLSYLQSKLKTKWLVRAMPNTPAMVQEGITVMSLGECFTSRDLAIVREMFMGVGKVLILPEHYMDAVTALSGSGPAFFALFVEAMEEAGIAMGLTENNASELAVQTLIGTARFLEEGIPPSKLREMVTSPGGTTAAGLLVFKEKGLNDIVTEALMAARKRASELGRRV